MLRNSSSLPVLPVVRSSRDCGAEHYKRASATIFGGLDYQRKQQQRHKSLSSRFLDFKLKGGEQAEERNRRRKMENVRKLMREASRLFQKADANHDGTLDFNEFCELVQMQAVLQRRCDALSREPGRADSSGAAPFPSRTMLRDWFHLIDFDHSGVLSMTEFFAFSLRETLAVSMDGANLGTFLSIWGGSATNTIESEEFIKVTQSLGFSAITNDLLEQCGGARTGAGEGGSSVSLPIPEITRVLSGKAEGEDGAQFFESAGRLAQRPIDTLWKRNERRAKGSPKARLKHRPVTQSGLVPQMDMKTCFGIVAALSRVDQHAQRREFYDPANAELRKTQSVDEALSLLRSWLRLTGLRALDIFQTWDVDGNFTVSMRELGDGLSQWGLSLTIELVTLIFDRLAEGYKLTYDEFRDWFESTTKGGDEGDEERERRAAMYIQKIVRGRRDRRIARAAGNRAAAALPTGL